jgi:hypothetical protein
MHKSIEEKAIAEATRRLLPLFIDIQSWDDPSAKNTERAHQHATALLEHPGPISETARQNAISALKHKRTPGRHKELNARRDRIIAETVEALCDQFGISQEKASSITAQALEELYNCHYKYLIFLEKRGADSIWICDCLKHIDNLKVQEKRIQEIAKGNRRNCS